jgi:ribokinase
VPKADALICQLEVPTDTVAKAANEFEGLLCVNLAPAKHVDVAVLQRADVIIVNEVEAAWYGESLSAASGMIVTTVGAAGATIAKDGEDIAFARPPRIEAVDTTAAGDTFTAALTVAMVEGQSPQEALQFACVAGAAACTKLGAQPSLPTRDVIASIATQSQ